jgi:O-antigen/teichoic acid export membrane protein
MNHSKFYSSLVLLIMVNAVIKPIWIFGIDRQVQNITGITEYGTYFALLNLSIVFGFLLDWGLTNFINRELATKRYDLQEQLGSFLLLKFLFALVYVLITASVAFLSGVKRWDILIGVMVVQFLTFLFVFFRSVITANQWFITDAWLSVLDKALMIVACSVLIFVPSLLGPITIRKFLIAQIASSSVAIIISIIVLLARRIAIRKPTLKLFNRAILLSALPFAITVFLMSIHVRLDGFLLERIHSNGAHEAGIYAAAYRLLDVSNMVGYLISSFFMPYIARLWSEGKSLQQPILQTRHLQLMFAITIAAITIVLAPWLQKILYHRVDPYGAKILQWCLPALIGYALVQVYGTVLTASGGIGAFCMLNVVAVTVNVIMNLLFIPRYGALGCCVSALCSQLLLGTAAMVSVHTKLKTRVDKQSLILYFAYGALLLAGLYAMLKLPVNKAFLLPMAFVTTFLFMSVTNMFALNNWRSFLKKQ